MKTSKCCGMSPISAGHGPRSTPPPSATVAFLDCRSIRGQFASVLLPLGGREDEENEIQGICAELLKRKVREPVLPPNGQNLEG